MTGRFRNVHRELLAHLPFTVFSVAAGMIVVGFMTYGGLAEQMSPATAPDAHAHGDPAVGMFHLFHPLHILFSASATTAMFWRFSRRWLPALFIGATGSLAICGLSDIFLPYVSGWLLGGHMRLHVCLIEHPGLILPFAAVGLLLGFLLPADRRSTLFSHTSHVFISAMASILYLVGFGLTGWTDQAGLVFIFMVLAVMLPCCLSDIVYPLLFVGGGDAHDHHCPH